MSGPSRVLRAPLSAAVFSATLALCAGKSNADSRMLLEQPPREVEFRLSKPRATGSVDLLLPLRDITSERLGPFRMYSSGPWGSWIHTSRWSLGWRASSTGAPETIFPTEPQPLESIALPTDAPPLHIVRDRSWMGPFANGSFAPTFDTTGSSLSTDGFDGIFRLPPLKPVVDWRCRRKPVLVMRAGGESDRFELVRCDGSVAPEALDRLSILARPPDAARPGDLLPDEPSPTAWERHEWTDGVRIVHPRLVWALQQIADAFPNKAVFLYSGYRPLAEVNDSNHHKSLHADGRALDIGVNKVPAEELFRVCTKLRGIGCGLYPHNKFIHLDVRRAGAGEAFFVDTSLPGEPAKYATDYPGVLEHGKLVGQPKNP